ncbi:MAG: lipopolysaccharide biosynthesis protein [Caulobacteraceae bacterium]
MFWKGVIGYLPANLVQGVVGLLSIVVFTRLLSPAAYGAYALAFSAMSLVHTLGFTWLEAAMARFYAAEAERGRLPDHFATLYRSYLGLTIAMAMIAGAVVWLLPLEPPLKIAVAAGLAAIPARSLARLAQEHRRAAGRVRASALLDMGQTGGAFLIGAGLAALGAGGAAPLIGLGLAAVLCLVFVLPEELEIARGGHFDRRQASVYAHYGVPVSLSLILALAIATTDRFVLAAYLGPASVGVYHAGYSLSNRTLDVLFIWLGAAGGPAAVAALERGGPAALERTAREQASLMLLVCLPAAVGLALVAKPLAALMVGADLSGGAARVTPWIAFSGFFSGITTYYLHTAFTLGRRTKRLLLAMTIPAAANLALTLVLIPRFGLDGAMWATAASYLIGALASWGLGRAAVSLPVPWNALWRCAAAAAGMAVAVSLVPAGGGLLELVDKAAVGIVAYAVLAFALDAADVRSRGGELVRALHRVAA